jgi:hypothetical protein
MSKKPMTTAAMANAMRANPSIACRAPAHEPMSTLVGHVVGLAANRYPRPAFTMCSRLWKGDAGVTGRGGGYARM